MAYETSIMTCSLCRSVLAIRHHETTCRVCGVEFTSQFQTKMPKANVISIESSLDFDLSDIKLPFIEQLIARFGLFLSEKIDSFRTLLNFFSARFVPNIHFFLLLSRSPLGSISVTNHSYPGIYYIVNLQNKFRPIFYVGESSNVGERLKSHLETLQAGKHHSKFNSDQSINLQSDFTKYGPGAFYYGVLKQLPSVRRYSREEIEAHFIKKLGSYRSGYNAVPHQSIARRRHGRLR